MWRMSEVQEEGKQPRILQSVYSSQKSQSDYLSVTAPSPAACVYFVIYQISAVTNLQSKLWSCRRLP